MLQKAIKVLKIGQTSIHIIPKAKSAYSILKRFKKPKKKKNKKRKKIMFKINVKKGFRIIKEYCYYIRRIFAILKERYL